MKTRLLVLLCCILMILVACKTQPPIANDEAIAITAITLIEDEERIAIEVTIDFDELHIDVDKILYVGILIMKGDAPLIDEFIAENADDYDQTSYMLEGVARFFLSDLPIEEYNIPHHIRAYVIYFENEMSASFLFANTFETTTLYSLAKNKTSNFAMDVVAYVEQKMVEVVEIAIDTKDYLVSTESNKYLVDLKTDYNQITITITLKPSYRFADAVELIANDKIIDEDKFTLNKTALVYVFDDPNWTKPY